MTGGGPRMHLLCDRMLDPPDWEPLYWAGRAQSIHRTGDPVMAHDETFPRDLLDHMFEGVYICDHKRRITFWNRSAQRITGHAAEDILGKRCSADILVHLDDRGNAICSQQCPIEHTTINGIGTERRAFILHRDGHRLPVSIRTVPITDPDGQVIGAIEIFSDHSVEASVRQQMAELEKLSLLDPLTEVANRRCVEMSLHSRLEEMGRYETPFGIVFSDLDRFKEINDDHGHAVGDEVLRMVARTLSRNARVFDTIGRWGGDEFIGVVVNVSTNSITAVAEKFRILVENSVLVENRRHIRVTVSVGAAMARKEDTPDSILRRADRAMYAAKAAGGNRVCCVT